MGYYRFPVANRSITLNPLTELLVKRDIPTESVVRAVARVSTVPMPSIVALVEELEVRVDRKDYEKAAKNIVAAIIAGADTAAKVQEAVYKRIPKVAVVVAPPRVLAVSPVASGLPTVETNAMLATPVNPANVAPVVGRRGRKKLGNSDFNKVVGILDANPNVGRDAALNLLIAAGIKKSSAVVYVWRYNKGERD